MAETVLMKGNEALAEAAILAGCRHYFGYPITPQTEIGAYLSRRMPQIGGVFLQAESEVAAIHMLYGASCAGKRAMTSSSSPGISLKSEGLQRAGPGLGGIQPSQADYMQATRGGGHGDFRNIVLAPASVQEMADLTMRGFDLADEYRMTAMILSDGMIGQMMEPVKLEAPTPIHVEKPWALTGTGGTREKNIITSLYLSPKELEEKNLSRFARYKLVEERETDYEAFCMEDAEICLVAYGISARVARNAVSAARAKGIRAGLIRPITLWPFPNAALREAANTVKAFLSVEMSMGQMMQDIELAIRCTRPVTLVSRVGGVIPSPEEVLAAIERAIKEAAV